MAESMSGSRVVSGENRKTISPYDITSLDNPGFTITQVQLKGNNYEEWARSFRTALRARKKFGFIDGSIARPSEESEDWEDWWTINSLLVSWIRNTIESTLRSTISHVEIARDLWLDIKDRFSITNGPRIQQLRSQLADCKQRGMTIMDYYGKLKQLWDELGNFEQLPVCKCGKCTCNLSSELEKRREEEKVHLFLMGLDEQRFGTTRSNILAQDPLPGLHKVYSILTQEEQVKGMTRGREEQGEFVAFVARNRTDGRHQGSMTRTDGQEKGICSHCHKSGHGEDNCFALTGYPEWWGDRPRGDERREAGRGRGYSGGRGRGRGHRGTHRANAALTNIGSSSATIADAGGSSSLSFPGLSDEQWAKLKAILGEPKEITDKMTGPHLEDADWCG
ncbi:uncharacterized protein [Populus alba]|uniref:uncharacterized protein n=1 Tax=Populus alba TaxID=43335 RepID=UPI003CC6F6D6